jgi:transcriptional regulator with GAF, ATPase, and Fis domain
LEAALRLWLQVGNGYMEGNARCLLGEIARREGHLAEADLQLSQADAALESAGAVHERSEILLERAHLLLLRGDLAGARALVQRLRGEASAAGQRELHGRALVLSAQTELESAPFRPLQTEKLAQIDDDLRLALELLPTSKPLHRTLAAALRVRLLLQRGRLQEAVELAAEQMALVERVALTLEGPERTAFERAPGDAAPRAVLIAVAQLHLDPATQGGRSGLLPTLVAINRRLGGQRDVAELLETVMDSAVLLTGAERGFLLIDDGDCADPPELRAARLRVAVARNLDRENLKRPQHKLSHSVAEQVFASGETVLSLDAQLDARFAEQASVHTGSLRSILCVPLRAQSGALGVVYVDNRFASGAFTAEHAALLAALADQAAIALQTARLIAEQRATAEALEKARAEVESLNGQLRAQLAEVEDQLDHARADLDAQRLAIVRRSDYSQIKGESPHLLRLFGLMDRVRDHDFPVLLRGESGTGKELVARAIHFTGRRKRGPFVAVNCGALPPNLLESELFGHTRGAFTGAVAERRGLFEAAHGGTLLLDEVGEMPLEMQVKLLRVLQTGEITRVGETASRKVDARVVAATHRDLQAMVGQGSFREDLLYRLKVVELVIPPLRQRPEDIPLLVEYFTAENRKASLGNVQRVSKAAMARLVQFSWPGNIRQLETVLKAACLFADSTVLELLDIEPLLSRERADVAVAHGQSDPGAWWESASLLEIEERLLASRLARFDGNKKRAAESLGIDRGTLYNKLREKGGRP